MKKKKKHGFTLAEILITLSIIGVVAALTIPTLIQRTGNEELVSRLNKAYSTLSQATEAIMTENGAPSAWASSSDAVYKLYKEHLRNSKACGSSSGCFYDGVYKTLNGKDYANMNNWGNQYRTLVLSDGSSIMVDDEAYSSCSGGKAFGVNAGWCAHFYADINGKKAPNTMGRDLFLFVIRKEGLYPWGCDEDGWCNPSSSDAHGTGWGCACKVIQEGAMNY